MLTCFDGPPVSLGAWETTVLDGPGHGDGDVDGLRLMAIPPIVGQMGGATCRRGHHDVVSAECVVVLTLIALGGLGLAVVGWEGTATSLAFRDGDGVSGHL
jgi:hypothetical protein